MLTTGHSNHMTSHEGWFSYLEKPEQTGVVEIGDNTPDLIEHVSEVPLSHVGQKWKLMNVLHVPTITKNLVSIGQIVDQGMCWEICPSGWEGEYELNRVE